MAEVVADIAEPLLRNLGDEFDLAAYDGALRAAAVLWNSRLLRMKTGLVDPIAELKTAMVTPTPPEFERLYQKVLDRAELLSQLGPDDRWCASSTPVWWRVQDRSCKRRIAGAEHNAQLRAAVLSADDGLARRPLTRTFVSSGRQVHSTRGIRAVRAGRSAGDRRRIERRF
jgi:hypothetical protein